MNISGLRAAISIRNRRTCLLVLPSNALSVSCLEFVLISRIFFFYLKDEENEYGIKFGVSNLSRREGVLGVGMTTTLSENSYDTESTDYKDLSSLYEKFRSIFTEFNVSEKDQQYIFKAFENKSEQDIRLFVQ